MIKGIDCTCSRCICVRSGRKYTFCRTLSYGTCKNGLRDTGDETADPVNETADSVVDTVDPSPICGESVKSSSITLMISSMQNWLRLLVLLFFRVMVVVLMIPGALIGFMHAVCQADSMTYLVEQWAVNLLIYLLQRFSCWLITLLCLDVLPSDTTEKSYGESWF